jgi:HK97 gp10 family phage protein
MGLMKNSALGMSFNSQDIKKMRHAMNQLPKAVFKRQVRNAVKKAITPMKKRAQQLAPKKSGLLKRSISSKTKTYKNTGNVVGMIGGGPHAHLVEFGHRIVTGGTAARISGKRRGKSDAATNKANTGKGSVVGFVPGRPFLRPAFIETKNESASIYRERILIGIDTEAKKLAAKSR